MAKSKKSTSRKIGRDAATGRFISVKDAQRLKKTAVVETVTVARSTGHDFFKFKPVHIVSGVSATAIRKNLKIRSKDIKVAGIAVNKVLKKKKTTTKK